MPNSVKHRNQNSNWTHVRIPCLLGREYITPPMPTPEELASNLVEALSYYCAYLHEFAMLKKQIRTPSKRYRVHAHFYTSLWCQKTRFECGRSAVISLRISTEVGAVTRASVESGRSAIVSLRSAAQNGDAKKKQILLWSKRYRITAHFYTSFRYQIN